VTDRGRPIPDFIRNAKIAGNYGSHDDDDEKPTRRRRRAKDERLLDVVWAGTQLIDTVLDVRGDERVDLTDFDADSGETRH
jgi:hypothetical protein